MAPYQYPQVPRSSGRPLRVETQQNTVRNSAFSWIDTPAEAEARLVQRRSEAPPLPQLPDTISVAPVHSQEAPAYTSQEQLLRQESPEFPEDMKHRYKPEEVPQHEVQAVHYAATTTDPRQQYQEQYEQPPDTPKEPAEPEPAHYVVGPDANPLHTPTTPVTPQVPHANTTNMTVIPPPSDPPLYPVSNYRPTAIPERGGTFSHGLFSCSSPGICLPALFCPCLIYGKTQYRLSRRSDKKDPTNMLGYNAVNGSCVAFGILCGINGILSAIQRTRVRRAYEMDGEAGNVVGDCIKGCCCCCCVVAQDEKEVKLREEDARKASHGKGVKEGYVAPVGMVFGVPPR